MTVDTPSASMDAHILTNWLDTEHALKPPSIPVQLPSDWLSINQSIESNEPVSSLSDDSVKQLLHSFDISFDRGFIGDVDPLISLPVDSPYYVWEILMQQLTGRLHAHCVRNPIEKLPVLHVTSSDLNSAELRRAQLVLSMLAHAYVWGETPVVQTLPACLSVPWVEVSHLLGRVPVLTHSSIILSNWRLIDPIGPVRLSNVTTVNQFYGGIDEAIFYLVTLEVEAVGAPAIPHMLRAQHAAKQLATYHNQSINDKSSMNQSINHIEQWQSLTAELNAVSEILTQMTAALMLMFNDCDPYVFYTRVRSFLSGWRGNPALPQGLLYEGVSEHRQLFHGGSAAQSCIVSLFDAFLGVSHERVQTKQFMSDMRFYMPGTHRQFLQLIENQCSIRSFLATYLQPSQNQDQVSKTLDSTMLVGHVNDPLIATAVTAFNQVVNTMVHFRTKHIGVVSTYILAQAHNLKMRIAPTPLTHSQSMSQSIEQNVKIAGGDLTGNEGEGVATSERGTGGTSIMPYLKTARDNTKDRILPMVSHTN